MRLRPLLGRTYGTAYGNRRDSINPAEKQHSNRISCECGAFANFHAGVACSAPHHAARLLIDKRPDRPRISSVCYLIRDQFACNLILLLRCDIATVLNLTKLLSTFTNHKPFSESKKVVNTSDTMNVQ